MREILANIAVITATIATLLFIVPQIVKLVRTHDSEGISTTWPAMGLVSNIGWCVYLAYEALWASVAAPAGATIGFAVILWVLGRTGRPLGAGAARAAALSGLLIVTTVLGGWAALGMALGLTFGLQVAPSVWSAYRSPHPTGISPGTWWLGLAEAFLWGFYGWHHADAGIITWAVVAALGATAMLARYWVAVSRRSRSRSGAPLP